MPKVTVPFDILVADLQDPDWQKRCDAARLLGQSKDPRAVDLLLPDLKEPDWRVRRNVAQALTEALQDCTLTVRERTAVGLGRIKDPQSTPALLEAFLRTDKLHVGNAPYQTLRKFGRKAALQLVEAFEQAPNAYFIDLLLDAKAEGLVELLFPLLASTDPFMRQQE